MKTVNVIYGRNNLPFSWLIRAFTWSRWSHCGIVDGDNVIEATAKHGVKVTPIAEFKRRYRSFAIAELPCREQDPISVARQQIGKKYDWSAVFSLVLRTGWNSDDKWFCSELIAHCIGLFRSDRTGRVTPEELWKISK